jgi:hypothetical protein
VQLGAETFQPLIAINSLRNTGFSHKHSPRQSNGRLNLEAHQASRRRATSGASLERPRASGGKIE